MSHVTEKPLFYAFFSHEAQVRMDFPLLPLLFNLALLGVSLFIGRVINASRGRMAWNGALLFFVCCFVAMLLDFILTMVFASASSHEHTQYESVASRTAWLERVLGYLIPCAISLFLALRFRRRQQFAEASGRGETVKGRRSAVTL
jgi:hypothetical protein